MTSDPPAACSGSDLLGAALAYAERRWPVIPLWWPIRTGCACPGGRGCQHPGKHPIGSAVPRGCLDATTDPQTIREWWSRFRPANVGIACGPASFDVLDVDGPEGEASLAALVALHGALPETTEVRTGRGRQLYFAPSGLPCSAGKLGPGLDTRGAGGYVVAPPSLHMNGTRYSFTREVPLASGA